MRRKKEWREREEERQRGGGGENTGRVDKEMDFRDGRKRATGGVDLR